MVTKFRGSKWSLSVNILIYFFFLVRINILMLLLLHLGHCRRQEYQHKPLIIFLGDTNLFWWECFLEYAWFGPHLTQEVYPLDGYLTALTIWLMQLKRWQVMTKDALAQSQYRSIQNRTSSRKASSGTDTCTKNLILGSFVHLKL